MEKKRSIPLSSPDITGKEIDAVVQVLETPQLSLGPVLTEFEEKFAAYLGVEHAVAVNSGTSALHLAVRSLGIGEGDAVITTPFSFVASANCLLYEKALPLFVDIDPATFNISPERIEELLALRCRRDSRGRTVHRESGRTVKAILPVHVFGHPCEMERIMEIAGRYRLAVIEDACEAIGAEYHGRKAGTLGECGIFAFYPNKQMTTGEGGMLVTRDPGLARLCRSMRNQGRDLEGGWLAHARLGYNYRISDINCALGVAQLARIEEILEKRDAVARLYDSLLEGGVTLPAQVPGVKRSWFVYVVLLKGENPSRDAVLRELAARGIGCSNYFPPIHLQPLYRKEYGCAPGDYPVTERVAGSTVALPLYNTLGPEEVRFVARTLREIVAAPPAGRLERRTVPREPQGALRLPTTGGVS